MRSLEYETNNSFKLRVTGNGPAFSDRCIGLNTITPDITLHGIWGFLFSILPVKTGPVSPENLGSLAIHILYVTILFMRPKFSRLKIWAFLYLIGKPLSGLAKPS